MGDDRSLHGEPDSPVAAPAHDACRACGLSPSPAWDTADGRIHLCPPCASLHGIGCG